jgi:glycosyltransferase involved in cell wall biosynthesis
LKTFQVNPAPFGSETPKASVLMLTYNHAPFIRQAIQSVLDQKTDFVFELIIGEDGSGDETPDFVRQFEREYPQTIRAMFAEKNLGVTANFQRILRAARGDYVALLEGDDYWTSPDKLQFQVEWLEARRECTLAFHPVELVQEGTQSPGKIFPEEAPPRVTVEDLFRENLIPTCSVLFRREHLETVPRWVEDLPMLDWPLLIFLTQHGPAGLIPRVMAAYRIHRNGAWTQTPPKKRSEAIAELLLQVDRHFEGRYWSTLQRRLAEVYSHIAWCNEEQHLLPEAIQANWKSISTWPAGPARHKANLLRLCLKHFSPTTYLWLHRLKSVLPTTGFL